MSSSPHESHLGKWVASCVYLCSWPSHSFLTWDHLLKANMVLITLRGWFLVKNQEPLCSPLHWPLREILQLTAKLSSLNWEGKEVSTMTTDLPSLCFHTDTVLSFLGLIPLTASLAHKPSWHKGNWFSCLSLRHELVDLCPFWTKPITFHLLAIHSNMNHLDCSPIALLSPFFFLSHTISTGLWLLFFCLFN